MKKLIIILIAIFLLSAQKNFSQGRCGGTIYSGERMNTDFSLLEGYGEWIEIGFNQFVWRPVYVSETWRPYSIGRWLWTDYGWYWDSYEPFGGVTYHYGRWNYDYNLGWIWFPDYEWGPAWVEWRYSSSYIGWAPLPPNSVRRRTAGVVSISYYDSYYNWNFVGYNNFYGRNLERHLIHGRRASSVFENSKRRRSSYYRDGKAYNGGIERNIIEQRSGREIRIRDVSNNIYRVKRKVERKNPISAGQYENRTKRSAHSINHRGENTKKRNRDLNERERTRISANKSGGEKFKSSGRNGKESSRGGSSNNRKVRKHR
ncbi:MAG: hypothetical protein GXO87_08560 [Chlorobi bacterium]|nr:hypothetical protein [Chlorobiota bacterium]